MHDEILEWIELFIETKGYAPTYREIMEGVGLSSTSQVSWYIDELIEEGKLVKEAGQARTLRIIKELAGKKPD